MPQDLPPTLPSLLTDPVNAGTPLVEEPTVPTKPTLVPLKKKSAFAFSLDRIGSVQKIFFTQNLSIMVKTGFALSQALRTLVLQTQHRKLKETIDALRTSVEGGVSFSDALAKFPRVFSELFVNMVAAGEQSGKLDEALERLTVQMKKDHALIAKVRGALIYPIIVVIAMVGIAIGMTVFVIPKLTGFFAQENATLPLATRVLVGVSNFLVSKGLYVTVGVIVLIAIFLRAIRTERGRLAFHGSLLQTPIVGPIIRKINLARFMRTLASLLQTDIPIIQSFQIISRTMGNAHYRGAMLTASNELRRGVAIATALEHHPKLFPPMITQMVSVGEQSGTLDEMASQIATFYEEDVEETMATLSTIIEPILILILGGGVALMAIAIIMPIYSLSEQIQ